MKRRLVIKPRFFILLALIAAVLFGIQLIRVECRIAKQRNVLADLDSQVAEAEEYNELLNAKLDASKDPEVIEQKAREQLGWIKDGETLYIDGDGSNAE